MRKLEMMLARAFQKQVARVKRHPPGCERERTLVDSEELELGIDVLLLSLLICWHVHVG